MSGFEIREEGMGTTLSATGIPIEMFAMARAVRRGEWSFMIERLDGVILAITVFLDYVYFDGGGLERREGFYGQVDPVCTVEHE